MRNFKLIIVTGLFLLSTITHAEPDDLSNTKNEGLGFGIGAIIGGLIAGPPGAVIGAAGGSFFGHKETKAYASLEKQLQQKNSELALLQSELAKNITQRRAEIARSMRNVSLENKRSALKKLENGLSMSVYFRTNGSAIDSTLLPHIHELATLIKHYSELRVQLFAHADHRGKPEYNMVLSKSRAQSVRNSLIDAGVPDSHIYSHSHGEAKANNKDREGLIFDRRVDIHLTIESEV